MNVKWFEVYLKDFPMDMKKKLKKAHVEIFFECMKKILIKLKKNIEKLEKILIKFYRKSCYKN